MEIQVLTFAEAKQPEYKEKKGEGYMQYGQTAEGNVATGDLILASKWANLVNKTASAATHQGSSITSVTAPVAGGTITYISAIPTNLTTIYNI